MIWKIKDQTLLLNKTLLMGIVNLTPDSFSDGGAFHSSKQAVSHCLKLIQEGADILDLGAESTRPGARPISVELELDRLLPVLKLLRQENPKIPISIDTTKPAVARACLEYGANIINDVSGLRESGIEMAQIVRDFDAGIVLMHRRGISENMQYFADYENVAQEVMKELRVSLDRALEQGIDRSQIVLDPGLGFAKNKEHNLMILRSLEKFQEWHFPVLLGPSRKSFIGEVTGRDVANRDFGTAAVSALAVYKGVQILRVHHVASTRDVVKIIEAIKGDSYVRAF